MGDAWIAALDRRPAIHPTPKVNPFAIAHHMEPLLILFLLPALIGIVSELVFRDTKNASVAATLGVALVVCLGLRGLDPEGTWNWLAALLVLPLPIAFALAAVIIFYGRSRVRRRRDNGDD